MNSVVVTGNITNDLESIQVGEHTKLEFGLAIRRDKENTDFIQIQAWNQQATTLITYAGKGHKVGIVGEIRVDNYQAKDGTNRYKTYILARQIELLQPKTPEQQQADASVKAIKEEQARRESQTQYPNPQYGQTTSRPSRPTRPTVPTQDVVEEDDLPF